MRRVLAGEIPMRSIEVAKEMLLTKLKENREKHIAEYNEAREAFHVQAAQALRDLADKVAKGDTCLHVQLPLPTSHEDDYDTAIGMLEWETRDKVTVTTEEFESYVMDKWDWQKAFASTVSNYKGR